MCINMVNERLQQFMTNVLIIQEKKIYEAEEIPFVDLEFKDNSNIIQVFEMKVKSWILLITQLKAFIFTFEVIGIIPVLKIIQWIKGTRYREMYIYIYFRKLEFGQL